MASEGDCPICFNPLSEPTDADSTTKTTTITDTRQGTKETTTTTTTLSTTTTRCSHTFHSSCLDFWVTRSASSSPSDNTTRPSNTATCPLCRRSIFASHPGWIRVSRPDGWRAWTQLTPRGECQHVSARSPAPESRLVQIEMFKYFVHPQPELDLQGDSENEDAPVSWPEGFEVDAAAATEAMQNVLDLLAEVPRCNAIAEFPFGGPSATLPLWLSYTVSPSFNARKVSFVILAPVIACRWERAQRMEFEGEMGPLVLQKGLDLRAVAVRAKLRESVRQGFVPPISWTWVSRDEGRSERRGEREDLENQEDLPP